MIPSLESISLIYQKYNFQKKTKMDTTQEQVVMTPKCKTANSTTLIIERRAVNKTNEKMHVAGGEHTGIIINKETTNGKNPKCCVSKPSNSINNF